MDHQLYINNALNENARLLEVIKKDLSKEIIKISKNISNVLSTGRTIFWCGNGGSAADCQHMAAEFVVRFKKNRVALSSIALTTDTSVLTAIANDFSSKEIFSRQIEAIARPKDMLICLSTSGMSESIIEALKISRAREVLTLSLLGNDGGKARDLSDNAIIVPSKTTARIQEIHIMICHLLCELAEVELGFW